MRNAHLVIGEITKPQGVRGELKLRPITCDLGRFEDLKTAYLKRGDDFEEIHVRVTRIGADAVFFFMEGIDDRNAAERLRGELVYVDRAHAERAKHERRVADLRLHLREPARPRRHHAQRRPLHVAPEVPQQPVDLLVQQVLPRRHTRLCACAHSFFVWGVWELWFWFLFFLFL